VDLEPLQPPRIGVERFQLEIAETGDDTNGYGL